MKFSFKSIGDFDSTVNLYKGDRIMRIVKFIIFKVVELAGAFLVLWGLSCYGYWIDTILDSQLKHGTMLEKWIEAPFVGIFFGLGLPLLGIIVFVAFCTGIILWIKWNWKKAGEWGA